jgi:hypothetical protein
VEASEHLNIFRLFNTTADLYRKTVEKTWGDGSTEIMEPSYTGAHIRDGYIHAPSISNEHDFGWNLQSDNFPCRISSEKPREASVGATEFAEADGVVYVESDLDIQRGDEVRDGTKRYEVLGVRDPSVPNSHREVIVRIENRGRN